MILKIDISKNILEDYMKKKFQQLF